MLSMVACLLLMSMVRSSEETPLFFNLKEQAGMNESPREDQNFNIILSRADPSEGILQFILYSLFQKKVY